MLGNLHVRFGKGFQINGYKLGSNFYFTIIIALPTGVKIFSWLSFSLSKKKLTHSDLNIYKSRLSSLTHSPNFLSSDLIIFGQILFTTVNYPFYTQYIRNIIILTPNIKNIIVSILISDGKLCKKNKSNNKFIKFRLSIIHSSFLFFCFFKLSHYCSSYPKFIEIKLNKKKYQLQEIQTRTLNCFNEFNKFFDSSYNKILPSDFFDYVNFEMLAFWIMFSGHPNGKGLDLYTNYNLKDIIYIMNILLIKQQIKTTLYNKGSNYHIIYFKSKSVKKLIPKILPYMCPSMYYKQGGWLTSHSKK